MKNPRAKIVPYPTGILSRQKPKEIHDRPCASCPSAHFPIDPESEDILEWPIEERLKTVFSCAWRPEKLCRGYWDLMYPEDNSPALEGNDSPR